MGILSKLFGSKTTSEAYTPKSEQEAWIGIMYASMFIDEHISDPELEEMFLLLEKQPLFISKHVADYYQPVMLANRKIGSYALIDACALRVAENHTALMFGLIMKLLLVDGKLKLKEEEIAAYLSKALNLEIEISRKIIDELLIKE